MKLIKYQQLNDVEYFLDILFSDTIVESSENIFKNTFLDNLKIHKIILDKYDKIIDKLNRLAYILIKNSNLNITINDKNIVLFTLSALSVCLLDENKYDKIEYKKEIKSILEELKLNGIGNNLVKILSEIIKEILIISKCIFKTKDVYNSLNSKNLIKSIIVYVEKYKIDLYDFCSKINELIDVIKKFFIKNGSLDDFKLNHKQSKILLVNEYILENANISGKTLICVDIQEAYKKWISFDLYKWVDMINSHDGNIVFLYNGPDQGYVDETEYKIWLMDIGIEERIIENATFFEKSYGYFRYPIDFGISKESIVNLVKFMIENKMSESGRITHSDINHGIGLWDKFVDEYGNEDIRDLLDGAGECIWIPELIRFLKNYDNIVLCGGAEDACLLEVEIALEAINKSYELYKQFVY